ILDGGVDVVLEVALWIALSAPGIGDLPVTQRTLSPVLVALIQLRDELVQGLPLSRWVCLSAAVHELNPVGVAIQAIARSDPLISGCPVCAAGVPHQP